MTILPQPGRRGRTSLSHQRLRGRSLPAMTPVCALWINRPSMLRPLTDLFMEQPLSELDYRHERRRLRGQAVLTFEKRAGGTEQAMTDDETFLRTEEEDRARLEQLVAEGEKRMTEQVLLTLPIVQVTR